jgi:outer membrane protein, heavy metal efflux system
LLLDRWRLCVAVLTLVATATLRAGPSRAESTKPDAPPHVAGPLTLRQAFDLTTKFHASLRAADLRAAAGRERTRDAGRWLNPEIGVTEENFGGSLGNDLREGTLDLGQTFELGGDRKARSATANAGSLLASADAALIRRESLARTAERFITAWALQARLARLQEGARLTQQAIATADERFRAGATPVLERSRAEAQALMQGVERRRIEAELGIARRRLAASWGDREATFDSLRADPLTDSLPGPPSDPHPALLRASASETLAASRVRAAEAARVPDVTVSAGLRRLEEVEGTGFVASVALPLPLWNRGHGEVSAARHEYDAAQAERSATAQELDVERANAADRLQAAAAAYDTLRLSVRPARLDLIEELFRAYRAGRIGYLDLIAEQRNLLETDLALIEARAQLWRARIELELLAGNASGSVEER